MIHSLIPSRALFPAFQCYTLKSGRVWVWVSCAYVEKIGEPEDEAVRYIHYQN